jgi:hypothetical protein
VRGSEGSWEDDESDAWPANSIFSGREVKVFRKKQMMGQRVDILDENAYRAVKYVQRSKNTL